MGHLPDGAHTHGGDGVPVLPIVGGVAGLAVAVWVMANILIIGVIVGVIVIGAVVGVVALMRWTDRREARFAAELAARRQERLRAARTRTAIPATRTMAVESGPAEIHNHYHLHVDAYMAREMINRGN